MKRRAAAALAAVCMASVATPAARVAARVNNAGVALALQPSGDDLWRALRGGIVDPAEYDLYRALAIFDLSRVRARFGRVARTHPRDATGALLDLALSQDSLPPRERALARTLLARPSARRADTAYAGYSSAAHYTCSTNLCVHWETETSNAPPARDDEGNGVPDQVDKTVSVFEAVWTKEVAELGYRPPRADFKGPNQKPDIFLVDLGSDGTYGYCAIEDPSATEVSPRHASAFCAVDNDYSASQYPSGTPTENLQVTAAHEFFHAIQFGYDYTEDRWFMESTATWIEDEVFDAPNDQYQYLAASALAHPDVSLDYVGTPGEPSGLYRYGSWLFFRFLSEWVAGAHDPHIVREAWARADSAAGAPDDYSLEAVENALRARTRSFSSAFADFAAMNYLADAYYEEGNAYLRHLGQRPPHQAAFTLSSGERSTGTRTVSLDHLASRYVWIEPAPDLPPDTTVEVVFDLPPAATGASASAITFPAGGDGARIHRARLDADGNGRVVVPFAGLNRVMLSLSNASTRYSCNHGTEWSCRGRATDDAQTSTYRATLSGESPDTSDPAPTAPAESPAPSSSPSPQPSGGSSAPPDGPDDGGLLTGVSDSPDPFTPDGDGTADRTTITFTVGATALVTIKVFDLDGDLVRVVGKNLPTPPGYYFVKWNGRNKAGRRVAAGTYRYVVKGHTESGERDRERGTTTVVR